ncbi:hypothetical protein V6N13_082142 [Hibiscus sabdariffa]
MLPPPWCGDVLGISCPDPFGSMVYSTRLARTRADSLVYLCKSSPCFPIALCLVRLGGESGCPSRSLAAHRCTCPYWPGPVLPSAFSLSYKRSSSLACKFSACALVCLPAHYGVVACSR